MAVEQCPNCRRKISPDASACPKCGHPLTAQDWERSREKARQAAKRGGKVVGIVFLVIVALVVTANIVGTNAPPSQLSAIASSPSETQRLNEPMLTSGDAIFCAQLNDAIVIYKLWEANDLEGMRARDDTCWFVAKGRKMVVIGLSEVDPQFALTDITDLGTGSEEAWVKLQYVR